MRSPGRTAPPTTRPEKPRKSRSGRLTHCTGIRNGPSCTVVLDDHGLQVAHQRRAVVPGRVRARCRDVVALQRRQRDADDVVEPDLLRERAVLRFDAVEHVLRVADHVELVDGQHDLADAEERDQIAVPSRLRQHALAGIDQDHGDVGGRGAGDHVARVLLVARRIGDDEIALVGGEEAVGDVDGDALLALGVQAVEEQREVEIAALRAELPGVGFERRELVLVEHLRFVQQAADQRALAVVDAAAGDEAQHALVLVGFEILLDVPGDQMRRRAPSEIALLLLLFHRSGRIVVDDPALPLGGPRQQHFLDDRGQRVGFALDRAGQRIAAQRAEAHALHHRLSRPAPAACGRRRP